MSKNVPIVTPETTLAKRIFVVNETVATIIYILTRLARLPLEEKGKQP